MMAEGKNIERYVGRESHIVVTEISKENIKEGERKYCERNIISFSPPSS
jgi:hypothetical protein